MYDVKNGNLIFKFQLQNDQLSIIDNPTNLDVNIEQLKEKFEELIVQTNPKQQYGTEQTELEDVNEEPPYDPEKIRVDTKQASLRQVYE